MWKIYHFVGYGITGYHCVYGVPMRLPEHLAYMLEMKVSILSDVKSEQLTQATEECLDSGKCISWRLPWIMWGSQCRWKATLPRLMVAGGNNVLVKVAEVAARQRESANDRLCGGWSCLSGTPCASFPKGRSSCCFHAKQTPPQEALPLPILMDETCHVPSQGLMRRDIVDSWYQHHRLWSFHCHRRGRPATEACNGSAVAYMLVFRFCCWGSASSFKSMLIQTMLNC